MANIIIDNQQYEVADGQNLLQACLSLKKDLPYFCWHPAMGSVGACRQCAMTQYHDENDTRGRLIVACMTPVTDGMRVSMEQPQETEFREQVIDALMTHHPHDCPVCAEGGECHLQDMTVMTGHYKRGFKGKKTTFQNQQLGPLIKHEMNRCITCYRCERFYKDYAGGTDLAAQSSRNKVYFGRQCDGTLESEFAGNLVEVCPTGVFTDKPFGDHYSRKWDMQAAPSVCQHCSTGCNVTLSERYGSVRRVTNRFNDHLNGYFLCDRGRFGFDFVNSEQRQQHISLGGQSVNWSDAEVQQRLKAKGTWVGIGSSQASLEDNFALQLLVGAENFCVADDPQSEHLLELHMAILQQWPQASLAQMEQADAIVIIGEDINNSAPRIGLAIRQALLNNAKQQVKNVGVPEWQDSAVRQVLPHNKVPLAVVGYQQGALAEQATIRLVADDKQTAEQAFLLANLLCEKSPKPRVSKVHSQIEEIAEVLKTAKRPLIVGGWSANNSAVLSAVANICKALANPQGMLCIAPPAANTVGLGLLMQAGYLANEAVESKLKSEECNLLVLDHTSDSRQQWLQTLSKQTNNVVCLQQLAQGENNSLSLPISSFSECSGSQLNYQGLIQSYSPASKPAGQCRPAWQWLVDLGKLQNIAELASVEHLGQLHLMMSKLFPTLAEHFTELSGRQFAMQSPRYSGRTAMLANQTVHEPKPFSEAGAPYKQSMEGLLPGQNDQHPLAYSWSPGWNSNQSNHKFRDEFRGPELKSQQGIFAVPNHPECFWFKWQASWSANTKANYKILAVEEVFGSDSLAEFAGAIQQLSKSAYVVVLPKVASSLNIEAGQWVTLDDHPTLFAVKISDHVPAKSILLYSPAHEAAISDGCDEIKVASKQKISALHKRQQAQQDVQSQQKQLHKQRLLDQDQHIPIQFIEGAM
ncbi:NADH-quinone oxidoreductase subunit NuoG [Alteromonadaceae bacterium BrNp21-10]|nr:NADH-quinone oxidoreductase subunit NuoG [Alteromonadaceae bacterium BrNp21-10]